MQESKIVRVEEKKVESFKEQGFDECDRGLSRVKGQSHREHEGAERRGSEGRWGAEEQGRVRGKEGRLVEERDNNVGGRCEGAREGAE
ncbi:hypothetical protein PoB_001089200 [Plakobranchus ocellatus]|uniref:Uncharacterized protein n=1 Tax=Plakobranchus ocellatus TaxID=259542 RepID=A0AAV3YPM3_9GAST|nr:hypothetical protein PoB_001089200 [Plakobranchus ocellatus]